MGAGWGGGGWGVGQLIMCFLLQIMDHSDSFVCATDSSPASVSLFPSVFFLITI